MTTPINININFNINYNNNVKEFGITKRMLIEKAANDYGKALVNEKGQIADQALLNKTLFAIMEERYSGGMKLQAQTFKGLISNAKDSIGTLLRTLSTPLFDRLKDGVKDILPYISAFTTFVKDGWGPAAKQLIESFGSEKGLEVAGFFTKIQLALNKVKPFVDDLKPSFENIWEILKNLAPIGKMAFQGIGLAIAGFMKYFPPLLESITGIVKGFTAWEGFIPVLVGLGAAILTYKGIINGIMIAENAWQAVQKTGLLLMKAQRAAQLAMAISGGGVRGAMLAMNAAMRVFNLTLLSNPLVLITSLLIGLGVALVVAYKKSETFRNVVNSAWVGIKKSFQTTIDWFTTTLPQWVDGVVNWFKSLKSRAIMEWYLLKMRTLILIQEMLMWAKTHFRGFFDFVAKTITNLKNFVAGLMKIIKGIFTGDWKLIKDGVVQAASALWSQTKNIFNTMRDGLSNIAGKIKSLLVDSWNSAKGRVSEIASDMKSGIVKKFEEIRDSAASLPWKIGKAIRDKISDATGAMKSLADSLVKKFKSALGINSPSRVFYDMAGWIIKGLVNGLSAGNLKTLGSSVFKDFAGGALSSLGAIKGFLTGGFGKVGGNVTAWLKQAMAITGVPASWLGPLSTIAKHESGGNPRAVNNWDINAKRGTPSMGLMQTIMPTFNANRIKGLDNILNPVHNAVAAINYIKKRYGNVFNVPGIKSLFRGGKYKGYAKGGFFLNGPEVGLFGEGGPEMALPLIGRNMLPYAQAVAGNLAKLLGGNFGGNGSNHYHTWNIDANDLNDVQRLISIFEEFTQAVTSR